MRQASENISNRELAAVMREIAGHLQRRGDSPFRVAAYRRAGATFGKCDQDVARVFVEQGEAGLRALPGIGKSIARVAAGFLRLGRSRKLERLRNSDAGGKRRIPHRLRQASQIAFIAVYTLYVISA